MAIRQYQEDTVEVFNNNEIRHCIQMLRLYPNEKLYRNRLQERLEERRFHRSDEPVTVYLVDFGGDQVYFRTMEDAQPWIDEMDWDEPPIVTTAIRTGREMGQMHCWEC